MQRMEILDRRVTEAQRNTMDKLELENRISERIIKCVGTILPVHQAQLLTYLKLTELNLGLILNFNADLMKSDVKRMAL